MPFKGQDAGSPITKVEIVTVVNRLLAIWFLVQTVALATGWRVRLTAFAPRS